MNPFVCNAPRMAVFGAFAGRFGAISGPGQGWKNLRGAAPGRKNKSGAMNPCESLDAPSHSAYISPTEFGVCHARTRLY
jgi:hypothetical protein